MKTPIILSVAMLATGLMVSSASAQDSATAGTQVAAPVPVHLDYAASEVAKLTQAKVNDDTIIAYINSSGNLFSLNAEQIIYLKQLGASDAVVKAMLTHPATAINTPVAPAAVSTTSSPVPTPSGPAPDVTSVAPTPTTIVTQPAVTYVQTVPSTYYSYPYPYYYGGYPYYGGYYGYPGVSFSFGGRWGGGWRGGGGWHR